jgi:hypothetical protein
MDEERTITLTRGTGAVTQRTFPKGILKKHATGRAPTLSERTPIIYKERGQSIRIVPNRNPSVAMRRSRKHIHGTKKLKVVAYSPATKSERRMKIKEEAEKLSKEELVDKLGGRVKKNTKAPLKLIQETYINMKESGLA